MTAQPLITDEPLPLLRLATRAEDLPLSIPPLSIVPRPARLTIELDSRAVQAWVLKLRSLKPGDAWWLPEYKVCACVSHSYTPYYVIMGVAMIYENDATTAERQHSAWRQIARWLVADNAQPTAAKYIRDDPDALRLCNSHSSGWYMVRVSQHAAGRWPLRLAHKPRSLKQHRTKACGKPRLLHLVA